jgi:TM2 domain-containing membrane protein YozV
MKNKGAAVLLCFFLGGLGAHKFYLGQTGLGVLYLLFCWTLIPGIVAFFEFFMLIFTPDDEFNRRFNSGSQYQSSTSAKDSTSALADLKQLYDNGVITAEEYEEKRKKLLRNL